jgi:hypothetical protein
MHTPSPLGRVAFAAALALALTGCGSLTSGQRAELNAVPSSGDFAVPPGSGPGLAAHAQSGPDRASVVPGPAADARLWHLLQAEPVTASVAELPALPQLDHAAKGASALVDNWQDGSLANAKSSGATVAGTSLHLPASASGTEWAIYRFPGIAAASQLQTLKLDTTGGSFSGEAPGYWVAVANYTTQHWQLLGRSSAATYTAPLDGSPAYLSPNGACYLAVLITGSQSVTVARAGLAINDSLWKTITLATGKAGLTPCIDFTQGNNPAVAWADAADGHGYFAICDRSSGFDTLSSWSISPFETNPQSATTPASPNARVQWLDLLIDPGVQLPRISLLYTGLDGTLNTCLGCTALGSDGSAVQWWNWRMAKSDGSFYTSIARNASDASYAIAYTAANTTRTANQSNDMEYRTIVWSDATKGQISSTEGQLYWGFGQNWLSPHLRISTSGKSTIVIDGGFAYQEQADLIHWQRFYDQADSLDFGSLALAPDQTPGMAFGYTGQAGQQQLAYVNFDGSFNGPLVAADQLSTGASNAIAETSQLAYQADGTPCIAYSYRTGQGIEIRYAVLNGANWTTETVSETNGLPSTPTTPAYLDLAVDSNKVAAVCWTQWSGANSSMVAALRGS